MNDKRGQRIPHEEKRVDFSAMFETNPFDLEALPQIPGMAYKWVTVDVLGKSNMQGYQKALMQHWRPVLLADIQTAAENTSKDVSFLMARELNGKDGYVGSHDMVLMMRPKDIDDAQRSYLRQQIDGQEMAVDNKFTGSLPQGIKRMPGNKVPMIDD
jgi:hypothetical protein